MWPFWDWLRYSPDFWKSATHPISVPVIISNVKLTAFKRIPIRLNSLCVMCNFLKRTWLHCRPGSSLLSPLHFLHSGFKFTEKTPFSGKERFVSESRERHAADTQQQVWGVTPFGFLTCKVGTQHGSEIPDTPGTLPKSLSLFYLGLEINAPCFATA